jgi:ribokinase
LNHREESIVKRPRIVVVGSSNTDMVVKAARIPAPGETVLGGAFAMVPGGKGANQAVAAALRVLGPPRVIVTLGGDGAVLADEAGIRHVPAHAVAAVDTTAAGDAFTGALATAVGRGAGWDDAVRLAAAAGALAATRLGAQPSLPTRKEWETFLAHHREFRA